MASFEDLLNALQNPNKSKKKKLENTSETWSKIGDGTIFDMLNGDRSEMEAFLDEWIDENPYNNI